MKLLPLFLIRLNRYYIPLTISILLVSLLLALSYRNILQYEQLKFQDRQLIVSLKNEAETFLSTVREKADSPSQDDIAYYKTTLKLSNAYLELEYVQGKSQPVIQTELSLYQHLQQGIENNRPIHQYSKNTLTGQVNHLTEVTQQELYFQYETAPRDFYLFLFQTLPLSRFLIPALSLTVCLWLLTTDKSGQLKFLLVNSITPTQYANNLTILAFLGNSCLYLVLFASQFLISHYYKFSFQQSYPILNAYDLSTLPVSEALRDTLLVNLSVIGISLLGLRLLTPTIVKIKI